jgi:hypothetical protein
MEGPSTNHSCMSESNATTAADRLLWWWCNLDDTKACAEVCGCCDICLDPVPGRDAVEGFVVVATLEMNACRSSGEGPPPPAVDGRATAARRRGPADNAEALERWLQEVEEGLPDDEWGRRMLNISGGGGVIVARKA